MAVASWWNTFQRKSASVAERQPFHAKPQNEFAGLFTTRHLPKLCLWRSSHWHDRILAAKQRDADADVSALEREIDRLVYALYDLMPAEIEVVESTQR